MGNPIMGAIGQLMRGMQNPQAMVQGMLNNNQFASNPMMRNALQMYQKGDMQGLQQMANNLAKERGTTVDQVKSDIMREFGMR